ncbi:enoyl-CoA hydratase/isomerase family protein [Nocardioides sp. TF02-7]|uniref:enoyl-CoA hydratase/isomerase family protein n=1 Tax=Nocardioides sp. TF02-7 TaxID=2917724 RepID=UPI001F069FF1|nr:enoyl-CoA hydratase/isomerase family protein [Nocardioides sp. TF02-7]UMG92985.1 enoyl-CoA hydratase/isomerase family protein [Nocardioides sp. TF02-7]
MTGEFVRLEVADGVGTIRLDRPKMNAISFQVQNELLVAAAEASARDDVRAVVLWGGERVFAAGNDVKEMAELSYVDMVDRVDQVQGAVTAIARIPKPVVAAVNGYALGGGCELALAADLRFAAEDAVLGQPEVLLGIIPGAGGTQRLARLVGPARAKNLVFTGRFVKAEEAKAIGLVDEVHPADQVYDAAVAWAAKFRHAAPYALRAAKESIDRGLDGDLETGLAIERQQFAAVFATEDRTTGMRSFVENGPRQGEVRRTVTGMAEKTERTTKTPGASGPDKPSRSASLGVARVPQHRVARRVDGLPAARAGPRDGRLHDRARRQPGQPAGADHRRPGRRVRPRLLRPRRAGQGVRRPQRPRQDRPLQLRHRRCGLPHHRPVPRAPDPSLTVGRGPPGRVR